MDVFEVEGRKWRAQVRGESLGSIKAVYEVASVIIACESVDEPRKVVYDDDFAESDVTANNWDGKGVHLLF